MQKITLEIDGMMCGMCEAHMNDLIRNHNKVQKVSSSVSRGETEIISEDVLDLSNLGEQVNGIGYELLDVKTEPYQKKKFFLFK